MRTRGKAKRKSAQLGRWTSLSSLLRGLSLSVVGIHAKQSQTWAIWGTWERCRGSCTNKPNCPKRGTEAASAVAAFGSPHCSSIPSFHHSSPLPILPNKANSPGGAGLSCTNKPNLACPAARRGVAMNKQSQLAGGAKWDAVRLYKQTQFGQEPFRGQVLCRQGLAVHRTRGEPPQNKANLAVVGSRLKNGCTNEPNSRVTAGTAQILMGGTPMLLTGRARPERSRRDARATDALRRHYEQDLCAKQTQFGQEPFGGQVLCREGVATNCMREEPR